MVEFVLLVGKIAFLVVLYWFVFMVVRSATRDLRAATPAPPPAASVRIAPAPAGRSSSGGAPPEPSRATAGLGPVVSGEPGRGWWALTVVSSPALQPGWTYEFPPGSTVLVGRAEDADVSVRDTFASSRHARVHALAGALEIEDLGSTNGTFVNGEEISASTLVGPSDEVAVGDTVFRVEAR
jgi:hypothetical protein